jgi:hypothetical protein
LALKTQEIQLYLIWCGLGLMVCLAVALAAAWNHYAPAIHLLAEYNNKQSNNNPATAAVSPPSAAAASSSGRKEKEA